MKNEENCNKFNLISKSILWILIIIYVIFIYVSLPFFPIFITTLRGFISKELLNLISLALTISFFLILSIWIYKKKYETKKFLLIISPLLLLTYLSISLDVWVERIHFVEYAFLGLLISRTIKVINLRGIIYFDNHEFRNNLDYSLLKFRDINQEVRELGNNNLTRAHQNRHRPVATTVNRIAASNTTPTTEFIDANGVELLVSGVSMIQEHQYLVKQKSINDASIFELGGIVLGAYQSIYVKSTAAVTATLLGFEETAEVAS